MNRCYLHFTEEGLTGIFQVEAVIVITLFTEMNMLRHRHLSDLFKVTQLASELWNPGGLTSEPVCRTTTPYERGGGKAIPHPGQNVFEIHSQP